MSRRRSRKDGGFQAELLFQIGAVLFLLAVWYGFAAGKTINPFLLPHPERVFSRLGKDLANFRIFQDVGVTLWRSFAGFVIAVVLGIPIGLAMARSAFGKWFFDPIVAIGFPAPKIAFMPIFLLWFGVGDLSLIVLVTIGCIFIVISATAAGASGVPRLLIWSAQSLGDSERKIFLRVVVPAALPQIMNGIQVSVPIALISSVGGEMLTGGIGLGGSILSAGRMADTVGVYSGLIVCCAVGFVLLKLAEWMRRSLLHWHAEAMAA